MIEKGLQSTSTVYAIEQIDTEIPKVKKTSLNFLKFNIEIKILTFVLLKPLSHLTPVYDSLTEFGDSKISENIYIDI